ncbi:hypothetical protein [Halodesulfurarchaeum formicicum]|uniref:Vitamin B12 dependent methionine synthase n=1 Tax=Halodesulfurarchaeum formicicum TaxID=1873524 RepID=A0A1J1AER8_9EURY|nr:hypothetical protein [Halodesulfurarchaeum formicicum]APE96215.1 vitamin B12 dependent methionine synthase [Halodesulfurarchaeum formicicum]
MSIGEPVVLRDISVELDLEQLETQPPFAQWLAAKSGAATRTRIETLREEVVASIDPRGLYLIEPTQESVIERYDPPAELVSGSHLVTGVVTLGEDPVATNELSRFDALLWDALENAALQDVREAMLEAIRAETDERGWNTTRVYAPGTKDDGWPLERREYVFEALPTEEIDCTLQGTYTEPRKTLTFTIGVGPDIEQAEFLLSCADCEILAECPYAGAKTMA